MRAARLGLALLVAIALSACSSPADNSAAFAVWATAQDFVVSVDAQPKSGAAGGDSLTAHLVVDGAIAAGELVSLSEAALEEAAGLGIDSPEINLIVGNAWGFSVDDDGVNVATINKLRDDPAFVGATLAYQPLEDTPDPADGLHGTVGSQAALRGANDALIAVVRNSGGEVDGLSIEAATADGAFGILGEGEAQPITAIQLWQAVSGRVVLTAAHAVLVSDGSERLEVTVGSAADRTTAESIGAQYPDVELTVDVG